jgi:Spy/CpxP family protein refolding chaperone
MDYARQEVIGKSNGMGAGQAMQMAMGRDQRIKSVLTPEQTAKYESSKAKATPTAAPANK